MRPVLVTNDPVRNRSPIRISVSTKAESNAKSGGTDFTPHCFSPQLRLDATATISKPVLNAPRELCYRTVTVFHATSKFETSATNLSIVADCQLNSLFVATMNVLFAGRFRYTQLRRTCCAPGSKGIDLCSFQFCSDVFRVASSWYFWQAANFKA